jgi:hypothetical protein
MTAFFALGVALAQSVPTIGPVHFHQTISVDQAFIYTMRGDRPEVTGGTLVVFEAPTKVLTPTQERQPIVYIGDWPVRIYASDLQCGCAAGWVPMVDGFVDAPLYLGPDTLPERVTGETAKESTRDATRQGTLPIAASPITMRSHPARKANDENALAELARAALRECP